MKLQLLSAAAILACASSAPAQNPLTRAERAPVCRSVDACVDILQRHDPGAFNYRLLADGFARQGERGARRLVALAKNPETAPRAFAVATHSTTPPATREAVFALFPQPNPELHIRMGRTHPSDTLRRRAIAALDSPARDAAIRALATQTQPFSDADARAALPALAKANRAKPSLPVTRLLAGIPDAAPELVRALGANNADVIVESFLALERLNADRARADLEAAFRASPASHAGAWTEALERIGRESRTFDAIAFGQANLRDNSLSPAHRAVMLHTALLYPATPERRVGSEASALVAELVKLPVSDRLADTVPTHPLFADPRHLRALLDVWQGRDTGSAARFARAVGKVGAPGSRAILRDMFARTPDYRVQVAVIEALDAMGVEDASWIREATARHPIRAVQAAGAAALGMQLSDPSPACLAAGGPWMRTADRLPYFQSGRMGDGRAPGRWELVDAKPFPGGWLAAYRGGLVRYASSDTAEFVPVIGTPVAVMADPLETGQTRARGFWVLTRGERVARLYRWTPRAGLLKPSTLPGSARVVKLTEAGASGLRDWAITFRDGQPTLTVTRQGRIQTVCAIRSPVRNR